MPFADNSERKREQMMKNSLYSPAFEHDNCGIGAVVNIKGIRSHATVENALTIVETLEHRAERTLREKQATAWALCCRFRINSFPKLQNH